MTLEALQRSSALSGLPDESLERLWASGEEIELAAGSWLMAEGSEPDAMYVLLEGGLEVSKRIGDEEVVIGAVTEGELVGELGLLHGRPRSASVRASTPCRLLAIPATSLDELLGHARTSRTLLAAATRRLENQELLLLQHGRMAALGSLTAGLLHELNNPAAAVGRAVDRLPATVDQVLESDRDLVESAGDGLAEYLERVADRRATPSRDPLERADEEERWRRWLDVRGARQSWRVAGSLAAAGLSPTEFESLAEDLPPMALESAARWLAARLDVERLVEEAAVGAERISAIVGAVKAYSHHDEAPVQDVDVHAGLEAALTLLRHKIPGGVRIKRSYADEPPVIEGFPGDLNVVWTNLIDNALDAVGESGTVELVTRADGDDVVVEIVDDGPGVPPEVTDRIFDAFFTTKPVGFGTGLGLATSQAIVTQRHRGRIGLTSDDGRTVVGVRLPRRQTRPRAEDNRIATT